VAKPTFWNTDDMTAAEILSIARRVIDIEARGLTALSEALGEGFQQAVQVILRAKGRVIVSGMGKSGHVARKIASTLASTGTPAQYVHPAEASHGDLGMVTPDDVVMILSNSGETTELSDIIAHTRRFEIPLIGVAARDGSTLLRQSDVVILLPQAEEACGTGNVPTTSTTMALALGDALAVVLMEQRQFTPDHFRTFHPGGRLGAQLTRVRDLMHTGAEVPLVASGTGMGDALLEISRKGIGVVGITDAAGSLTGIITDGDLRRHMDGLLSLTVDQVMTPRPGTISPDALAQAALATMNGRKITCLFVVTPGGNGRPDGILHIHDCLRAGVV
jgi:arabinose-5-phosphate isomerase